MIIFIFGVHANIQENNEKIPKYFDHCFLTHFMPLISFYTPWKHQKTSDFLMFSGGIERDQWDEMG